MLKTIPSKFIRTLYNNSMWGTRAAAAEILKKREEKARGRNLVINQAEMLALGNNTQGLNHSLLVGSEGNYFLFNCGEGTQRFCYSNKVKIASLHNVFITNRAWNNVAGLYGLSLTLQDIGSPGLCIHSTEGIEEFFDVTNSFITFNTGIQCTTKNQHQPVHTYPGLEVRSITLDSQQIVRNTTEEDIDDESCNKRIKFRPKLLAYVCKLPDLPGPLDPAKCRELNVPIGPMLATLKSGKDITLADGSIVKSIDVCGDKSKGLRFLVIECISEGCIDNLLANTELEDWRKSRMEIDRQEIDLVVHFGPNHIVGSSSYQNWLNGFSPNCRHFFMSNPDTVGLDFYEVYRFQYLLNKLDSDIFPPLYLPENKKKYYEKQMEEFDNKLYAEKDLIDENSDTYEHKVIHDVDKKLKLNSLDKFLLRPNQFMEAVQPGLPMDALYRDTQILADFQEMYDELKKTQENFSKPKEYEPEIVFLGTGSALPAKLRNLSCILVNLHHRDASVILDCGEDSYGQLLRFYGPEETKKVLERLRLIYISHHHADHHLGLIQLLIQRRKVTNKPVTLLLPPNIENLMIHYNMNYESIADTYEIFNTKANMTSPTANLLNANVIERNRINLFKPLGDLLEDISIVSVNHCINSCAVVMKFKINHPDMPTFSLAYSGDARPSEDFVIVGKKCDVLIHEATFDFRSQDQAIIKKHSTTTEAIEVGRQMEAKFTILTHFSQRHPKIPYFTEHFDEKVGFAFDNLSVRCPSQLPRLPILKRILASIFEKSLYDTDLKFIKKEEKERVKNNLLFGSSAPT